MRILTNIVNEYKQYRDKLCTNNGKQLNKTKLLAMIVYKNYYPQDFALLHRRSGKIYNCINSKSLFINEVLKINKEKIKEITDRETVFLNNLHFQLFELRLLLLYKWNSTIGQEIISLYLNKTYYSFEQIADDDELFEILLSINRIQYRFTNYYGNN